MIPIWLALLLSWALLAVILAICSQFNLGVSFDNEITMYILCAPVLIPVFAIGIPIALCIRCFNELKYYLEKRKRQKKGKGLK